eukprot:CAMPEP_0168775368 /NCGR_PEP_ID=MMETSP0725-20121227/5479_1 /TAXON_ID=265536 /ORGANISM="Amphiprora sp., Strain CCMP467" /LENGTH=79 /DNA_ID=CAMNT_0008825001 /DNA_START=600 /DNA_END=839 /DNA_ORIENTATION=-
MGWLDVGKGFAGALVPKSRAAPFKVIVQENIEGNITIVGVIGQVGSFLSVVADDKHVVGANASLGDSKNPRHEGRQSSV